MNDASKTTPQTFDKALQPSIERSTGMNAFMHTSTSAHSQAILNTDECVAGWHLPWHVYLLLSCWRSQYFSESMSVLQVWNVTQSSDHGAVNTREVAQGDQVIRYKKPSFYSGAIPKSLQVLWYCRTTVLRGAFSSANFSLQRCLGTLVPFKKHTPCEEGCSVLEILNTANSTCTVVLLFQS